MRNMQIVSIGEGLVELAHLPEGSKPPVTRGIGGDTSNMCIAAQRHGVQATYLSRIGNDATGRYLRSCWQEEGVDIQGVVVDPHANTGAYVIAHDAAGHHFSYLREGSAASLMSVADVERWRPIIESAQMLHISGISMAISPSAEAAVLQAARVAKAAGVLVQFDFNIRPKLWNNDRALAAVQAVLPWVDIALPGVEDMQLLTGEKEPSQIVQWCHAAGATNVILKDGARGVWASVPEEQFFYPAKAVKHVVDATGAGDCFGGCLAAVKMQGASWRHAVAYASCAAALSVQHKGAVDGIPSPVQVRDALTNWRWG